MRAFTGGVLWDLDGTLIDSTEYHWQTWHDTLRDAGYPITRDQFAASFGQRNDTVIRHLTHPDIDDETAVALSNAKEASYRELLIAQGIALLPGAAAWLERLHADGWAQAIVTSAPRRNLTAVLYALGDLPYFATTVAAEDVLHGKPDPQPFVLAAARLDLPASRCIVVEDAPAGIQAGQAAGMATVGVLTHQDTLSADIVVSSLADLPPDAFTRLLESRG